ncbi:MAG: dTDP-4-dehydrorhamnose reductase [Candidatus Acidiferrales bacterium]|jgi:dTDP-4-dehydrorhamnose reductase
MKPRILLTGKTGQIGQELQRLLPDLGDVTAPDREQLDLLKPTDIQRAIRDVRPHLIVNAAGYTAVDQAEADKATAHVINAEAPALMAEEARSIGASLLHYSTDYVFDGMKTSPYDESDSPNPINVYGRTKLEGEQAIRKSGVPHLIFRTAWVYGTRGRNFLLSILRLATQQTDLRVVSDQVGAPTWSRAVASATSTILAQLLDRGFDLASLQKVSGTYHMTAAGETSWCDFAKAILEESSAITPSTPWVAAATNGQPLIAERVIPISTREYPTAAVRPVYSVLSNARLASTFNCQLPDWRTQLHVVFGESERSAPS